MKSCSVKRMLMAAAILSAAPLAVGSQGSFGPYPVLGTENTLARALEAQKAGDYAASMELVMEVILYQPGNDRARELMREVAGQAARLETGGIQAERLRLLEAARATYQEGGGAVGRHAAWGRGLKRRLKGLEFLAAYEFLYELRERWSEDDWITAKLAELQATVPWRRADLELKGERYNSAVLGYYAYTAGRWSEARQSWLAALRIRDAPGQDMAMRRYLAMAERNSRADAQRNPLGPPARSGSAPEPRAVFRPRPSPAPFVAAPMASARKHAALAPADKPAAPKAPARVPASAEGLAQELYTRALEARKKGDKEAAVDLLRQAVARDPKLEPAAKALDSLSRQMAYERYLAGLIHYGQGRIKEAIQEWEGALEARPEDQNARKAIERGRKDLKEDPR